MKRHARQHPLTRLIRRVTPGTASLLTLLLPALPCALQAQSVPEPSTAPAESDDGQAVIQKIGAVSRLSRSAGSATEYSAIIQQCQQILETPPDSPEHVRYVQSLQSWALNRRARTRMDLADQFQKIGNEAQAQQVLERACRDLDAAIAADPGKWQALKNRAILLTRLEQYQRAVDDWSELIARRPDSGDARVARFNRGELLYELGQFDEALTDYRAAVAANPRDLPALNGCGNCLLALNQPEPAIEFYDRILQIDRGNSGALVNRGDARQQVQQWAGALQDYRDSMAAAPEGPAMQRLAWLLATCPDESLCDPDEALTIIRQAIASEGETPENLETLAAAWAAAGQFDKARDVQTRVIALSDSPNEAYQVRQTLYENQERYRQPGDGDQ